LRNSRRVTDVDGAEASNVVNEANAS
jgi:hypothetical protein